MTMSSFGSKRSGVGAWPAPSARAAAAMLSLPQPVSAFRPSGQSAQPLSGLAGVADRSSSQETWSEVSVGSSEKSVAAAAVTCGAENEVPAAWRYSLGPQLE